MNPLATLTSARFSAFIFIAALLAVYVAAPIAIENLAYDRNYWGQLALMATVAALCIWIGFSLPIIDRQFDYRQRRLRIDVKYLHVLVWVAFALFVITTIATAPAIPIWSALFEVRTVEELDALRGAFLKKREGWEAALLYVSTIFTGMFLPYSMARLFIDKSRFRLPAMVAFLGYAELFLQKALFIQVVAPLFYLVAQRKIWNALGFLALVVGCAGLLYLNTVLARGVIPPSDFERIIAERQIAEKERRGEKEVEAEGTDGQLATPGVQLVPPKFFSAKFRPISSAEHLVWRMVSVPIFTAADALRMFDVKFQGELLWGSTSTAIAKLTGTRRVPYEIQLFGFQWGYNDIAASNSVYITEAFVNFGWPGVVVFSLCIGQAFRAFWKSSDDAFKAMWPLFAFNIIQAGLIGALLSNGYALLFLVGLFVSFESRQRTSDVRSVPETEVASARA